MNIISNSIMSKMIDVLHYDVLNDWSFVYIMESTCPHVCFD
jgi:hypothetical protein